MFAGSFKSAKKYETAGQYTLKNFQGMYKENNYFNIVLVRKSLIFFLI